MRLALRRYPDEAARGYQEAAALPCVASDWRTKVGNTQLLNRYAVLLRIGDAFHVPSCLFLPHAFDGFREIEDMLVRPVISSLTNVPVLGRRPHVFGFGRRAADTSPTKPR